MNHGSIPRLEHDYQADIDMIGRIAAVTTILEIVCKTTGMGFAAVARVDDGRWVACSVRDTIQFGLRPGGELAVETTICHEIRQDGKAVVIDHVATHPVYCTHKTPALYGFQSYISMPIVLPDGRFFGTLCAIDPQPRTLNTPEVIGMFKLFAELIALQIDSHERMEASAVDLSREREASVIREQFVAVLGHDLRNPLAAIDACMTILQKTHLNDRAVGIAQMVRNSVQRMSGLIDDVLDLTRGRLGGGIPLRREADRALAAAIRQVVDEAVVSAPDRVIAAEIDIRRPVYSDSARIGQLLSNLLGNAITHGASDEPVRVRATVADGMFELSVANGGEPIPDDLIGRLFQPFLRGAEAADRAGLGLGLYISSEIARAHGGELSVVSHPRETRFTFRMPADPA